MKVSVLVPSTNQVVTLGRLLRQLRKPGVDEIIVAARPGFRKAAQRSGARVVPCGRTRGSDYNAAAAAARGDVLVLLHQNTIRIPRDLFLDIKRVMEDPAIVGGGVDVAFDRPHRLLKLVAFLSNQYRMRLRNIIYADQTIFVRRAVFRRLRGFKAMPIFEDTEFSSRLRRKGKLAFLRGPVVTSAHRFVRTGILAHTLRNQLLKLGYCLGIPPKALKQIYEWRIS